MASHTFFGLNAEELENNQNQQQHSGERASPVMVSSLDPNEQQHFPVEGASLVMVSSPPASSHKRKRNHPGNPSMKKHYYRKHGDLKAQNKICGMRNYKCACGTMMSRRDGFIYHCSVCDDLAEKVARHTTNSPPYSSMARSNLANASNPGSMSLGAAAGSMIPGNDQQLSSPLSGLGASRSNSFTSLLSGQLVGSPFHPIQAPKTPLHQIPHPKSSFPRASDFSGIHGFPSYTAPRNMYSFGFNGGADFNSPQSDLDLKINNSFRGLMMNAEASAYNIQNSTLPSPQLSKTALLQKDTMTGATSNNASSRKSMGSSLSGRALGDGMSSGGGGRGGGSTFKRMYNNLNVGGGSYGRAEGHGGGMEYLSDQMNAPYGGMIYFLVPIQPPNMPLHRGAERKISFPRASDFSGIYDFPSYAAPSNLSNFGGGADFSSAQNDLYLNINNSFSGLLLNAEASAYNILNSNSASPQLSNTALIQKAGMTRANSNNVSLMKTMGSSFAGGMKFNSYTGALGDGMSCGGGGGTGGGSTFEGMYNNFNVGSGSYGSAGGYGGGMEYLSDQMNAPYGGMIYNVNNADGMLVGEVNNNGVVEPHMNVQSGGGMMDDHNSNGIETESPDSEATTSAEARPFLPGRCRGF